MLKLYFKQAWQLLKQNKLFCSIYIIGTGLAIAMVLFLAILYYIKIAPVYPETNRNRIVVVSLLEEQSIDKSSMSSGALSHKAVKEMFYTLKTPEVVSAVLLSYEENFVALTGGELKQVSVEYTDAAFWQVFSFSFMNGKPYSEEEFASGIPVVVVSESLSKQLFGTTESVGKRFELNFREYRVCGVVKDVSYLTPSTYAQIWLPYTCNKDYEQTFGSMGLIGPMKVYMLAKSSKDFPAISKEVAEKERTLNATEKEYNLHLHGQPDPYWESIFRYHSNQDIDWKELIKSNLLLLALLLLVPIINLSGMIASRVGKQVEEMGIRKVFGASKRALLSQLLYENLFLTFCGGLLGLLFSYLMVFLCRNWFSDLFVEWVSPLPEGVNVALTPSMLINPTVFLLTFLVCLILNTLSTLLPAWKSLQRNIVDSLSINK